MYPDAHGAAGETLQFSAQDSSGNPVKEDWDFTGDGKWDAHGMAASHAWTQAGTFTVKLRPAEIVMVPVLVKVAGLPD